jgi:prepilin-type N-terminal cleavage/methylation domain-containing protein
MKFPSSSSRSAAGFTLVEILVSLAVLGLMMLGVAQILNGTLITSLGAYKHMDADTEARMVLDRMAFDIAHIVKRTDVDYVFQKNSLAGSMHGNDQMAFYSESGGYYPSGISGSAGGGGGEVSLVGYMIPNNAVTPSLNNQLCRLSKGIAWNGYSSSLPAMVFNPLASLATGTTTVSVNSGAYNNTLLTTSWNGTSNGIADGSDTNYQVIGDQVFRLEYTFLVQTSPSGAYATGTGTPTPYTLGGFYDYPWSPTGNNSVRGLQDVTAVVISIAILDSKSRAMLGTNTASYLNTAASDLVKDTCINGTTLTNYATGPAAGYLPLALWKTNLTAAAHLGLPKEVWQQVRFYQRFCYLNHLQ